MPTHHCMRCSKQVHVLGPFLRLACLRTCLGRSSSQSPPLRPVGFRWLAAGPCRVPSPPRPRSSLSLSLSSPYLYFRERDAHRQREGSRPREKKFQKRLPTTLYLDPKLNWRGGMKTVDKSHGKPLFYCILFST